MNKLRDCYNQLQQILGPDLEPYESVVLVENYRQYWKPDNVRIILLAESHVFTSDSDRSILIPKLVNLPGYLTEYAKFVYCLAYGERQLTRNESHPKRDGTPQFWKIFYSCNNHVTNVNEFRPVLSDTPYERRLNNKIELLSSMKKKGIWLVDSSIVALYNKGKKPKTKIMRSAIRRSWECYTSAVIREANPEHIICIGKAVVNILENDIKKLVGNSYTVIAQPNARLSAKEHLTNFKQYSKICANLLLRPDVG